MTKVFVEQPLALPGSANYSLYSGPHQGPQDQVPPQPQHLQRKNSRHMLLNPVMYMRYLPMWKPETLKSRTRSQKWINIFDADIIKKAEVETSIGPSCLLLNCDQCEYTNATKKGLSHHKRIKHRISQIDGPDDITEEEVIHEVQKGRSALWTI